MVTTCYIRNTTSNSSNTVQFTLLSTQAQGASSTLEGSIDVMLYRLINSDDGKGVDESLSDKVQYTSNLQLRLNRVPDAPYDLRSVVFARQSLEFNNPIITLSGSPYGTFVYSELVSKSYINAELPNSVHLLSFDTVMNRNLTNRRSYNHLLDTSTTVMRLQHLGHENDTSVDLSDTLRSLDLEITEETKLSASKHLSNSVIDPKAIIVRKNQIRTFRLIRKQHVTTEQPKPTDIKPWIAYNKANYELSGLFSVGLLIVAALVLSLLCCISIVYLNEIRIKH